ncbi:hypothetical protein BROUX41_005059 [Berkeleyomyces rouxiae]|uniref:uncharacterized protein n=1 Tax=Berkeleyomyces rouxiae TaxID=2035830 RepID=UPI003B7D366F
MSALPHNNNAKDSIQVSMIEDSTVAIPRFLPHERVFPIQIGCKLFKLSGASISSDAPSYFSQWFQFKLQEAEEQNQTMAPVPTLYIDRDPETFADIALHLQGYHLRPRDGTHFVRIFADAQFYRLPKLISQLYEESIFMSIGGREFQIPRDLFTTPDNSPNYFSLGFAVLFSKKDSLFPGLERVGLLRPPSIIPPAVPSRSADIFEDILKMLRGYPIDIRNEKHREALLRDVRYFNFRGLEQRLIPHSISFNLRRKKTEMVVRLEDILKSGLSVVCDTDNIDQDPHTAWVNYMRPLVDKEPMELIVEIGVEQTRLRFSPNGDIRAQFYGMTNTKVGKLFCIIAGKIGLSSHTLDGGAATNNTPHTETAPRPGMTALSDELVRVALTSETSIILDGQKYIPETSDGDSNASGTFDASSSRKRQRTDQNYGGSLEEPEEWIVKKGQWRLKLQSSKNAHKPVECVLMGVKLDATSSEMSRNEERGFL